jgi:polyisoprenoid-binding protein YceI
MSDQLPQPGTWTIDSMHSFVEFTVEHFTVAFARGIAAGPTGTITIAADLLASSVRASVDVSTLTTANKMRDEKILGPDVLDAEQYPAIDFASRALRETPGGPAGYALDGDLTLHGITQPVTLAVTPHGVITDTWGKTRLGLTATAEIQRSDFDVLKFGYVALAAGGFMVPDTVRVTLEIEATRDLQAVHSDRSAPRSRIRNSISDEPSPVPPEP